MYEGDRLPSPHYEYAMDRLIRRLVKRRCKACHFRWPNWEIPVAKNWPERLCVWLCPQCFGPSKIPRAVYGGRIERYSSMPTGRAIPIAVSYGSVLRTRECADQGCLPIGKDGPTRWLTLEVVSDGTVVRDVTICPHCGSENTDSNYMRGTYSRAMKIVAGRRAEALRRREQDGGPGEADPSDSGSRILWWAEQLPPSGTGLAPKAQDLHDPGKAGEGDGDGLELFGPEEMGPLGLA